MNSRLKVVSSRIHKSLVSFIKHQPNNRLLYSFAIIAFAGIGTSILMSSHAATPATSIEAESGSLNGAVTTISDGTASGTSAIKFGATSTGTGDPLAALPRVAWDGGPAYYAQYSKAAARGFTDPNFFPLMVDFESVLSPSDAAKDKAYGVNGYFRLTSDSDLSSIRNAGMFAIPGAELNSSAGAETIGWDIDDEVDMWGGPGVAPWTGNYPGQGDICSPASASCGYTIMSNLVNGLPKSDGRIPMMNYGKGVAYWESDSDAGKFINNYTGLVSDDLYYYSDNNVISEAPNFEGIPSSQVRRAANYGEQTMARMRVLDALDGKRQPIYCFIETANQGAQDITSNMVAGAVMNSLIYECRGVIYFVHDFQAGNNFSYHVLRDNINNVTPGVTALNAQITSLAAVLNTQSYAWTFNANVSTMLKESAGSFYIFAMQKRSATTSGSFTYILPSGLTGATAQVVGESRSIPISGGKFTDSFAAEYSYHIYKITP